MKNKNNKKRFVKSVPSESTQTTYFYNFTNDDVDKLEKLKFISELPPGGYNINLSDPYWIMRLKFWFKKIFKTST